MPPGVEPFDPFSGLGPQSVHTKVFLIGRLEKAVTQLEHEMTGFRVLVTQLRWFTPTPRPHFQRKPGPEAVGEAGTILTQLETLIERISEKVKLVLILRNHVGRFAPGDTTREPSQPQATANTPPCDKYPMLILKIERTCISSKLAFENVRKDLNASLDSLTKVVSASEQGGAVPTKMTFDYGNAPYSAKVYHLIHLKDMLEEATSGLQTCEGLLDEFKEKNDTPEKRGISEGRGSASRQ